MKLIIVMAALLASGNSMGQPSSHRHLLIFGREKNKAIVQQQLDLLQKDSAGVAERAVKVSVVNAGDDLFKKYKVVEDQFTVILIGKDGYEKYRDNKLLATEKLFAIIDAMPMRRAEMKKGN